MRRRRRLGVVAAAIGLAFAAALLATAAPRWWRVFAFLPFWVSALGFLQARERT